MKTLQHHIGGSWTDSRSETFLDLVNPATEETIGRLPAGCADDVDDAVGAAVAAQTSWSSLSVADRTARIESWADRIAEHAGELAELECREMGKPVGLGRSFIEAGTAGLKAAASQALSYPFEKTVDLPGGSQTRIIRRPLGVAAVVIPWNFPVPMVLGALGPLLAAGNTVVVKPSERTPLATARLFELLDLPDGVVNLVLGDARSGQPLVAHGQVELVHFTGSVTTGQQVGAETGRLLHRSILELGGKDPVIVDADVDVAATAGAVAFGAFVNTGQICTSMERIYVHQDVADEFIDALAAAAETYTMGNGFDDGTMLGPLVNEQQRQIVHDHVTDALAGGASLRTGGQLPDGTGFFYPATVLTDVDDSMLVMTEETFGPVAPVSVVSSFDEGLERASNSTYGLAATVYSNDPEHIAAASRIPAGVVWVNQWQGGGPESIYEPARSSGMGATGSTASFDAATRPVSVHIAPPPDTPAEAPTSSATEPATASSAQ
ncbi:aldehyde dehydrogenase family protein [Arthrobacter castelli]|uniref:aldehyde dehydrogenase family protein n=1 Tax=Arthrobacter castelli TaxID=271431 RepID=UPI000420996F|nr:aldehyde dehydrogenase family protein [Arthrobacter castelli]